MIDIFEDDRRDVPTIVLLSSFLFSVDSAPHGIDDVVAR